jgi:hypothetical protein
MIGLAALIMASATRVDDVPGRSTYAHEELGAWGSCTPCRVAESGRCGDRSRSCNRVLGCNGKSRAKLSSLFKRPSVTTKFDGMWYFLHAYDGNPESRGEGQGPAGRYLRQREYPQPPPPSKNNTRRTINTVSMVYLTHKCKGAGAQTSYGFPSCSAWAWAAADACAVAST